MAIAKNGSRFTDRNRIRRLAAQGYTPEQISKAVSIVVEHVSYVLKEWDADEERWKDRERARRISENEAKASANVVPGSLEERLRREIQREMEMHREPGESRPRKRRESTEPRQRVSTEPKQRVPAPAVAEE
jgi:hypothetical protein